MKFELFFITELLFQRSFVSANITIPDVQASINNPDFFSNLLKQTEVVRYDDDTSIEGFNSLIKRTVNNNN